MKIFVRYLVLPWLILYMIVILLAFLSVPFIIVWFLALTASAEPTKWLALTSLVPLAGGCLLAYSWKIVNQFYMKVASEIVAESINILSSPEMLENSQDYHE